MVTNSSIDSFEKATYNSSIEDNRSYDVFEATNPNFSSKTTERAKNEYALPHDLGLSYQNQGYRDNSTFGGNSNSTSTTTFQNFNKNQPSDEEEAPIIHNHNYDYNSDYFNQDTLPLREKMQQPQNYQSSFLIELKSKVPARQELPDPPEPPINQVSKTISRSLSLTLIEIFYLIFFSMRLL